MRTSLPLQVLALVVLSCSASTPSTGSTPESLAPRLERPAHDGKTVLFGNLHSHSVLSDDVSDSTAGAQVQEGFTYAQAHGLDFLAISDHHMATDAAGRNSLTAAEFQNQLRQVALDFNTAQAGKFIALWAFEWGNIATGNHLNVVGSSALPPDTILNKEYDKLYAWALANAEFVQFNHPSSWQEAQNRDQTVGNFGEKLAALATPETFRIAADPCVATVAIMNSVRGGHISGQHKNSEAKTHREIQPANYAWYRKLLNQGFRISPSADQDTHGKNFGTVTASRTAVWADSVSYADLMKGFKANRVYATEDDELVVAFQVKYKAKTYWMGEDVPLEAEEADVELLVKVWQATGSDGDATDEGPYTVEIYVDVDGVGGVEASKLAGDRVAQSGQALSIPFSATRGRYLYLHVREQNGKDNAVGEGEDSDGDQKRDDLNDTAVTSPVWFTAGTAPAAFVWSVNSGVYHDLDCWAVRNIGAANRREGAVPTGKTKHDCHP